MGIHAGHQLYTHETSCPTDLVWYVVASISRLSPSTCTNCSVTFDPTLQFVRVEGESLEIEASMVVHVHDTNHHAVPKNMQALVCAVLLSLVV